MAKITPIDVIKGISGKYGGNANDYFATNSSSNKIHLAKYANPYTGDPTEKQLAVRSKFAARQAAATAWLNANKPSDENGDKGTTAYQYVEKLKKNYALSNINQVLYKYMDDKYVINLPAAAEDTTSTEAEDTDSQTSGGTTQDSSSTATKYKLTLVSSPENAGTLTGAGEFAAGDVSISATPASGYEFVRWSDNVTSASRTVSLSEDTTLTAYFDTVSSSDDGSFAG